MDTGNLGVSALLASTVQGIVQKFPDACIHLLESTRNPARKIVRVVDGKSVEIGSVGIRCNKTVWRENHLLRLLGSAALSRTLPRNWREKWLRRNPYLNAICSARAVMDITGGDSFSDIYGKRRIVLGSLRKIIVLLCGADLILMPQTYGPFKSHAARALACFIIRRAARVYTRDVQGLREVSNLIGNKKMKAVPHLYPDMAFVLAPLRPDSAQAKAIENMKADGQRLIGINISGYLWNGGFGGKKGLGLKCDYRVLIRKVVSSFAKKQDCSVLLVPHVIPEDSEVENDVSVCQEVWRTLLSAEREKVVVLDGEYDQSEVKYLIGLCDFFMGARMHSTIAALSQNVPAVGMAYSKKFAGVFQTAGAEECVIDMRQMDEGQILARIEELYLTRDSIRQRLTEAIPEVQRAVKSLFEGF